MINFIFTFNILHKLINLIKIFNKCDNFINLITNIEYDKH